jgi:hypothetical protein
MLVGKLQGTAGTRKQHLRVVTTQWAGGSEDGTLRMQHAVTLGGLAAQQCRHKVLLNHLSCFLESCLVNGQPIYLRTTQANL